MSQTTSPRFNADDSDLTIQSSSGELFKVHKHKIESHSNILKGKSIRVTYPSSPVEKPSITPPEEVPSGADTPPTVDRNSNSGTPIPTLPTSSFVAEAVTARVEESNDPPPTQEKTDSALPLIVLPESGTILELLLQYMYNQPQPDLSQLEFNALLDLADAAERYKVYAALEICRLYLRLAIPRHSLQIFNFALKYRLTALLDESAQYTIGTPLETLLPILSQQPQQLVAWMKYHRAWMDALTKVYGFRDPILRHWEGSPAASRSSSASPTPPHATNSANPNGTPAGTPAQATVIVPTTKLMANPCEVWAELWGTVGSRIQGRPEMLVPNEMDEIWRSIRELLGLRCTACERLIAEWEAEWKYAIGKVPKFSSFL